ncbi:MAG TPA: hypothetical protein VIX86_22015 [Streptosporangiaceae bacterium]
MVARWLAAGAAAWVAGFAVFYVVLIHNQGDSPVWWFIAVLAAAGIPLLIAALGKPVRPALFAATILLGGAALLGLLSIGLLLVPAVAAAAAVTAMAFRQPMAPAGRGPSRA